MMTSHAQNLLLGAVLLLLSGAWTWLVIDTIPAGFGDGDIGARAFPMAFGLILAGLSSILIARTALAGGPGTGAGPAAPTAGRGYRQAAWFVALKVLAVIVIYGLLLERVGFVLATPVAVFLVMIAGLGGQSVLKIVGMSLGLTAGCWLVFEKLIGIYLANGTWINLG